MAETPSLGVGEERFDCPLGVHLFLLVEMHP